MKLSSLLDCLISENEVRNIAVCVGKGDQVLTELYRSRDGEINESTKFDMASVSKILATTSLALIALDRGLLSLDTPVSRFFKCPKEKEVLTIRHLLTHTVGIGHKSLIAEGCSADTVAEDILKIPSDIPVGTNVRYSCPGFILLGKLLEQIFSKPLNVLFEELVTRPLGMSDTSFLPWQGSFVNSNMEAERIGTVNDYNCRFLDGVAGNAGVFSNMKDMKCYAKSILGSLSELISQSVFDLAVQNHTKGMDESRGLGFLYVDERYSQTGNLFASGAIGHCGHTGQSIFVDLKSGLYVIILSDMTVSTVKKYGCEKYGNVMEHRRQIHNAICDVLYQI